MSQNLQEGVIKRRDENAAILEQYADNKHKADQFNDVTVVAGSEGIATIDWFSLVTTSFLSQCFYDP